MISNPQKWTRVDAGPKEDASGAFRSTMATYPFSLRMASTVDSPRPEDLGSKVGRMSPNGSDATHPPETMKVRSSIFIVLHTSSSKRTRDWLPLQLLGLGIENPYNYTSARVSVKLDDCSMHPGQRYRHITGILSEVVGRTGIFAPMRTFTSCISTPVTVV